jgi:hypothetical protein
MLPAKAGFKFKEGENFNHKNTWGILRIKLKLHFVQNVEPDIPPMAGGKRGRFATVSLHVFIITAIYIIMKTA